MLFVGVDIGSTTTKCAILDKDQNLLAFSIMDTGFDRNASGEEILAKALGELAKTGKSASDIGRIVATGYGRKSFEKADEDIPEIIAHALGTSFCHPGTRTIIDIGGQDSKLIQLEENGNVEKFEMNDKCAAGTGRFFEVLTHRLLGIEMGKLSDLIKNAKNPSTISSMCTVFAETEIISYLSQNVPVEDIAAGMGLSIAVTSKALTTCKHCPSPSPKTYAPKVMNFCA